MLERVLEKRVRCELITCGLALMRQVQEKHQAKKNKLYYAFVDLEKAERGGEMGFAEAGCGLLANSQL